MAQLTRLNDRWTAARALARAARRARRTTRPEHATWTRTEQQRGAEIEQRRAKRLHHRALGATATITLERSPM
jgi:hypothetical protein